MRVEITTPHDVLFNKNENVKKTYINTRFEDGFLYEINNVNKIHMDNINKNMIIFEMEDSSVSCCVSFVDFMNIQEK